MAKVPAIVTVGTSMHQQAHYELVSSELKTSDAVGELLRNLKGLQKPSVTPTPIPLFRACSGHLLWRWHVAPVVEPHIW